MISTKWLITRTGNAFFHMVPDEQISLDLDDDVSTTPGSKMSYKKSDD